MTSQNKHSNPDTWKFQQQNYNVIFQSIHFKMFHHVLGEGCNAHEEFAAVKIGSSFPTKIIATNLIAC